MSPVTGSRATEERAGGPASPARVGADAAAAPAAVRAGWRGARAGEWPHLPPGTAQRGPGPPAWGEKGAE